MQETVELLEFRRFLVLCQVEALPGQGERVVVDIFGAVEVVVAGLGDHPDLHAGRDGTDLVHRQGVKHRGLALEG